MRRRSSGSVISDQSTSCEVVLAFFVGAPGRYRPWGLLVLPRELDDGILRCRLLSRGPAVVADLFMSCGRAVHLLVCVPVGRDLVRRGIGTLAIASLPPL